MSRVHWREATGRANALKENPLPKFGNGFFLLRVRFLADAVSIFANELRVAFLKHVVRIGRLTFL
jgi:hypothetical protein